jgi:DNA-directed RNA polymerase subunit RPC12/RpoP
VELTLGGIEIMSGQKKTFLLPCAGCAHEIEVVTGQAGGQVECPACGRRNDVPKFRDLAQLPVKADVAAGQTHWGLPQAVALAGVACAALSWATAAWVGAVPKAALDANQIRANIEAGGDAALYQSLQDYARVPVDRPPFVIEVALQRQSLFAQAMSRTLYAIGGLGVLIAAAAGLAALGARKRA